MLSTMLVRQQADKDAREEFRVEIRQRFERGAKRMDAQDHVLEEIREHARKTNGRVTRLEDADISRRMDSIELAEKGIRTELDKFKGGMQVLFVIAGLLQAIGLTLLNFYLRK